MGAGLLAALLPCLACCSSLPAPHRLPFDDHAVAASYVAPADGRIRLPVSDPDLTVLSLRCAPRPLREEFAVDGHRYAVFRPGCEVRIEARLRSHARGDQPPTALPMLLPGAHTIAPLPSTKQEAPTAR